MSLAALQLARSDAGHRRIDQVTATFEPGRLHVLIGPNGSGKTSLLQALAGDLAPDAGRVAWQGEDLSHLDRRRLARVRAVLPQQMPEHLPYMVGEIIELGRLPWAGEARATTRAAVLRAAQSTGVEEYLEVPYNRLSGGQRARVQLARVLAQLDGVPTPAVFLLDEPTAYFDPYWQHVCLRLARELAAAGHIVVCVLHELNLAAQYADCLYLMQAGRLVLSGSPEAVLNDARLDRVYGLRFSRLTDPDAPGSILLRGDPAVEGATPQD